MSTILSKVSTLKAVVLKLQHTSESPRGLVKSTKLKCLGGKGQYFEFLKSSKMTLMIKNNTLRTITTFFDKTGFECFS